LTSLVVAVENCGTAALTIVDNNPGERLDATVAGFVDRATVVKSHASSVAGVRNDGVALGGESDFLVFVDSDCLVSSNFCSEVLRVFFETGAEVVGCKVVSPRDGHWTERAMDDVHRRGGDGPRSFLNSGCLAIRFDVFNQVGGFDAGLTANEDYDLCSRVGSVGGRIWQSEALAVLHLGNPKSVLGYFKRLAWHGEGVFGSTGKIDWSLMLFFVLGNAAVLSLGLVGSLYFALDLQLVAAVCLLLVSIIAVPLAFVVARAFQFRRRVPVISGVLLMQVTFVARLWGGVRRGYRLLGKSPRQRR
jgi:hypothetical protein